MIQKKKYTKETKEKIQKFRLLSKIPLSFRTSLDKLLYFAVRYI